VAATTQFVFFLQTSLSHLSLAAAEPFVVRWLRETRG